MRLLPYGSCRPSDDLTISRGVTVLLYVVAPFVLVVQESSPRRSECISQRHIGIFVSVIGRMRAPDCDLPVRQRDIDPERVEDSLMSMMCWGLGDDATSHDVVYELLDSPDELANASLECERRLHLTERDLQRKSHHQLLAIPGSL